MHNIRGKTGVLYVVATPIGNLDDFSLRGTHVLSSVHVIAAEDTRHSRKLLTRYSITTPMVTYNDHSSTAQREKLLQRLVRGEDIALITDAGTPLISDPGFRLVTEAQAAGARVVPIPGANAALAALSVAGLPSDRFAFEGFLPAKTPARRVRLAELKDESRTLIFYEAARRVHAVFEDLVDIFGSNREAVVARELTKEFETVRRAGLGELLQWLDNEPGQQRGEFVLLVHGAAKSGHSRLVLEPREIVTLLADVLPLNRAAELTARITGVKKNLLYKQALADRGEGRPDNA